MPENLRQKNLSLNIYSLTGQKARTLVQGKKRREYIQLCGMGEMKRVCLWQKEFTFLSLKWIQPEYLRDLFYGNKLLLKRRCLR